MPNEELVLHKEPGALPICHPITHHNFLPEAEADERQFVNHRLSFLVAGCWLVLLPTSA